MILRKLFFLVLLLLALPIRAGTPLPEQFLQKLIKVEKMWDPLIRKAFGCPVDGPADATTCRVAFGEIDYKNYKAHCKAVMELYEVKETVCETRL